MENAINGSANDLNDNSQIDEARLEQEYLNSLPDDVRSLLYFEDLVWDITKYPENIQKAKELVPEFPPDYVQLLIQYITSITFLNYKQFADLFKETGNCRIKFDKGEAFACYLYAKKIITASDFANSAGGPHQNGLLRPISFYENPIKEGTIWYYIWKDDVAGVKNFFDEHISKNYPSQMTFVWNDNIFTLQCFAAYFNSVEVLKYFKENGFQLTFITFTFAIQGGAINAINYIQNNAPSIHWDSTTTIVAIQNHQNTLAKLSYNIVANHSQPILPSCAQCFNTASLLYFLHVKKRDINETNYRNLLSCTNIAKEKCHNTILTNYLMYLGGRPIQCIFQTPLNELASHFLASINNGLLEEDFEEEEGFNYEEEVEEEYEEDIQNMDPENLPREGDLY